MMTNSEYDSKLLLGVDFDKWYGFRIKEGIYTDISPQTNSHTLICGMSGSGKSCLTVLEFARIIVIERQCNENSQLPAQYYFADFKMDDQFSCFRECPHYYPYDQTLIALEQVHSILHKRQSGEDKTRFPVTLIWDEYMANILALESLDKKKADNIKRKTAEILMLGRSLSVRLIASMQRGDATAFTSGSRLNFGVIMIVGAPIRSIYEMLIPKEYIECIGDRHFGVGEGVVLLQGSQLRFIKVPMVRNLDAMQQLCVDALSR